MIEAEAWTWWAARCAAGQVFRVCDELDAQGFETLAPAARTTFVRYGRKIEREYPVFGAYVFVGAPRGIGVFKRTHDKIEAVLGDSRGPIAVPVQAISAIGRLDAVGFWGPRGEAGTEFRRGEIVRICEGPLAGLTAIFVRIPRELRAIVEVSLLGFRTPVQVDACNLERA